jgi:hypothetical protein
MNTVTIGGMAYEVLYTTKPGRVVIRYDGGLVVLADQNRDGTWDLSGQPASTEEQAIITRYMPANNTTEVDIVKDTAKPLKAEEPVLLSPFMKNGFIYKFCDTMYRYTFGWAASMIDSYEAKRAEAWFKRLEKAIEPKPVIVPVPAPTGTDPTSVPNVKS